MRNISFALTTPQFLDGSKTVTRRNGWGNLAPGDLLMAVEKGMGLKKGEKAKKLGAIRVVSARREPLFMITPADVVAEGFPHFTPDQFIWFYCKANGGDAQQEVTRIEFERVSEIPANRPDHQPTQRKLSNGKGDPRLRGPVQSRGSPNS